MQRSSGRNYNKPEGISLELVLQLLIIGNSLLPSMIVEVKQICPEKFWSLDTPKVRTSSKPDAHLQRKGEELVRLWIKTQKV